MLRVPSSTSSSRSLNSRLSQTLTARKLRLPSWPMRTPSGIVAIGAVGRGAGGADPFRAALVAALLLGQALAQRLQQLVEAAHRLDLLLFFFGEVFLGQLLQPLGRDLGLDRLRRLKPLEDMAEHAIELVEIALVLHQARARQIIEFLDPTRRRDRPPSPASASDIRAASPARRRSLSSLKKLMNIATIRRWSLRPQRCQNGLTGAAVFDCDAKQ